MPDPADFDAFIPTNPRFDLPLPPIESRLPPELVFDSRWLITCQIPILIVTDNAAAGGYDETEGFHLGQILKILRTILGATSASV